MVPSDKERSETESKGSPEIPGGSLNSGCPEGTNREQPGILLVVEGGVAG